IRPVDRSPGPVSRQPVRPARVHSLRVRRGRSPRQPAPDAAHGGAVRRHRVHERLRVPAQTRRMLSAARAWRIIVAATVGVLVLGLASRFNPLPPGLRAEYFANPQWTPPRSFAAVQRDVSTAGTVRAWNGTPPSAFSVVWSGTVVTLRAASYTFGTVS